MGRLRPMGTYRIVEGIIKHVTPSSPRTRHPHVISFSHNNPQEIYYIVLPDYHGLNN